jgi:hypothetical protein
MFAVLAGCGSEPSPQPSQVLGASQANQAPVLSGIVRESGTQPPVANARICWFYPNCVATGEDGAYRIVHSGTPGNCPFVDAPGFEGRQDCGVVQTWNPTIQRTIRIEAGQTVAATIFSDDISGLQQEDYCVACKRLRILAPRSGRLTVRLTPENAGLRLAFAYTDQRSNDPFPVQAGQESPVTILTESPNAPRSFELSTVFVAD